MPSPKVVSVELTDWERLGWTRGAASD